MKEYNCPDCQRDDSCDGCQRVVQMNKITKVVTEYGKFIYNNNTTVVSDVCKKCSNHPTNGGSGVCHCTLGTQIIY
jgi:hypothetical protein